MTKDKNVLSKLQKSVRNFRNLRQCPRNTQAFLTTGNVRLFKTVFIYPPQTRFENFSLDTVPIIFCRVLGKLWAPPWAPDKTHSLH